MFDDFDVTITCEETNPDDDIETLNIILATLTLEELADYFGE